RDLVVLLRQAVVQGVALFLPVLAPSALGVLALGLHRFDLATALLGKLDRFLPCLVPGRELGLAIHDQEDQDQRPHRAQEHGEERERIRVRVPAASHAAFPEGEGRSASGAARKAATVAGSGAARAVSRWIAAVRLWTAFSNVPVPASVARFCCR